jgi:hypothetical protein
VLQLAEVMEIFHQLLFPSFVKSRIHPKEKLSGLILTALLMSWFSSINLGEKKIN